MHQCCSTQWPCLPFSGAGRELEGGFSILTHRSLHCQVAENWTYSLFFLVAELWGAVVISVLFWTLANEVCTVKEAKTIYPLMGIAANVALVAAGNFMKLVNRGLAVGGILVWCLYTSKCLRCPVAALR